MGDGGDVAVGVDPGAVDAVGESAGAVDGRFDVAVVPGVVDGVGGAVGVAGDDQRGAGVGGRGAGDAVEDPVEGVGAPYAQTASAPGAVIRSTWSTPNRWRIHSVTGA